MHRQFVKLRHSGRGVLVSSTRRCCIQSSGGEIDSPSGSEVIPFPPARPLAGRRGIYVKYFFPPGGDGAIFIRGDELPGRIGSQGALTGFPIPGTTGGTDPRVRKWNNVFIPISDQVPVRVMIGGNTEAACTIEIA